MKFWKLTLLSALAFFAITTTVLYTACTVDACADLKCANGGACISGYCNCPTGYEGAQCDQNTYTKFVGTYVGSTQCNQIPAIFDTATVFLENFPLSMGIALVSHLNDSLWQFNDTLHGTINGSQIIIGDTYLPRFSRHVTVTLNVDRLNIFDQEVHLVGNGIVDTNKQICNFYGTRIVTKK